MWKRALIVSTCLLLGSVLIARASKAERPPARQTFQAFPMQIGAWSGHELGPFDERVLGQLRVSDYLNRAYASRESGARIGLYIGYYETQRQGQTMHSPLNCLPGAGWQPAYRRSLAVEVQDGAVAPRRTIVVNQLLIEKGAERQMVLYWYQSHGRVVASEYWGKVWTVVDAMRMNRTDAAMVRVVAPVASANAADQETARRAAVQFTQALFPLLGGFLPR